MVVSSCWPAWSAVPATMTRPVTRRPRSAVETLDTDGLEQELKHQIELQTDTKLRTVDCPTVELEAGASFNCVAEGRSDTTDTIVVTQRDDQGNLDWEVTEDP